ncbi:uncharacterized protein LOC123536545 [Mercenaria mercenaria]|uniref:uncharacterized protein LOC123536545 n=1 Tax=Mercenaria mercenaria TaxID=6596 RepID=UPI00234F6B86|nr:uncharacterized protein LOC123536545 [Mercenaria mercenaria]
MKATRGHILIGARRAKQNPVAASTTVEEKCWYHPDRNIEMFCRTHNMVYCTRCIATEHRSCSGVTDIDHATKGSYSMDELQGLQSEINDIFERLVDVTKKKEKILAETEEQKTSILGRIKDMKRKIIDHVEKLERASTDALKEKYSEVKTELEEDKTSVNKMTGKLEERKKKVTMALHMNKGQRFVQVKLGQKAADDAKTLCKESDSKSLKDITFTEDEGISDTVMAKQSFGQIDIDGRQKTLVIKTVDVKKDCDELKCLIPDLCQLHDGTIILIDQRSCSLKKLDQYNKAKLLCNFGRVPTGICCTGKDKVAVKFMNSEVLVLAVCDAIYQKHVHIRKKISIENGGFWGLAYFAGDLWMSYRHGVRVYSMSGLLKRNITHVQGLNGIIQLSPVHLAAGQDSIFVTNGCDGALCLDKDGSQKYELQDHRLRFTRGVCVTSRGTVFLSGSQSNNVVVFNKDGKCLGGKRFQQIECLRKAQWHCCMTT